MRELWYLVQNDKEIIDKYRIKPGETLLNVVMSLTPGCHTSGVKKGEWTPWGFDYRYRGNYYTITMYPPQNAYHVYDHIKKRKTKSRNIKKSDYITVECVQIGPHLWSARIPSYSSRFIGSGKTRGEAKKEAMRVANELNWINYM